MNDDLRVNIAPGVSMLGILSHLNYKPWFALAEYVDNSVQSMLASTRSLKMVDGPDYKLVVSIDIEMVNGGSIVVRDNAAGIAVEDFHRAFRAAQVPPDRTGLSEFGMGMKSASCWFARDWSVRTKTAGSELGYRIDFDVADIVSEEIDELDMVPYDEASSAHYTEIRLTNLNHQPMGRGIAKIKQHLRDIYRVFLRDGTLVLRVNGESLSYAEPPVLVAPSYRAGDDLSPVEWRKPINFDLGGGKFVHGFAALRETGSTSNPGFALFRRGRVIEGSGEEGYRPVQIFGGGNSYRSQRLFGELNLDGFDVSHTKDGFQWDSTEDDFLAELKRQLDSDEMPLLRQAEGYRARTPPPDQTAIVARAVDSTALALASHLPSALPGIESLPVENAPSQMAPATVELEREIMFHHAGEDWQIVIEVSREDGNPSWLTRSFEIPSPGANLVRIRLNAVHPFFLRFGSHDEESSEIILRMAISIVVAEVLSRRSGVRDVGTMTRNIDELLSGVLSQP